MERLIEWKSGSHPLPLLIKGARQVGKTWLMKEFGRRYYPRTAYVNLDRNERMKSLFSGDFSLDRILRGLSLESGVAIGPENTLIILDEIQEVPAALQSLKYFSEDPTHSYHILAAGSLLGIALHAGTSFPVGKVETLELYPLSFPEFLDATGMGTFSDLLSSGDDSLVTAFKDKFIDALKTYYFVGGMPAAVLENVATGNPERVRAIQKRLLSDYELDFSKHVSKDVVPRLRMVWNGIPAQLAKENKKFIYSALREGSRAKEFEIAIQWLIDCGLCHKVNRIAKGGYPLKAYEDPSAFKLYLVDVGLLGAMTDLDVRTLLRGNAIFTEFKGALTEQYVCQQLFSAVKTVPYYWSAESSSGEVDFVIQHDGMVLPMEVKAEENLKAKSLKAFVEKFGIRTGIRISMSDFRVQERLLCLPLYAVSEIFGAFDRWSVEPSARQA